MKVHRPTHLQGKQDQMDEILIKKGTLETKTYVLKKKPEKKRRFKCSECNFMESSIHKLNEHHRCVVFVTERSL